MNADLIERARERWCMQKAPSGDWIETVCPPAVVAALLELLPAVQAWAETYRVSEPDEEPDYDFGGCGASIDLHQKAIDAEAAIAEALICGIEASKVAQIREYIATLETHNDRLRELAWQCCSALNFVWGVWNSGGRLRDAVYRVDEVLGRFRIPHPDYLLDPRDSKPAGGGE